SFKSEHREAAGQRRGFEESASIDFWERSRLGCNGRRPVGQNDRATSIEGVVAQTSQSARASAARVPKPLNALQALDTPRFLGSADLEVGDTAGLETCATGLRRCTPQISRDPLRSIAHTLIPFSCRIGLSN